MNKIAIKLNKVSKKYILHHEKPTLMESIFNGRNEEFWALKNISLAIMKGDRVGLIGPNGSGKTTLLKIITGITAPTQGKVQTNGKIISLIDLEAGFQPDLTGIQNIFLNGMLIGMGKAEINSKIQEIISFADIGKFIDAPLFTYSEGMKLRLGFAITVAADPDILILDENISVGDQNFRRKSFSKVKEYVDQKKTIIIASHFMGFVLEYCNKAIWLDHGVVKLYSKVEKVTEEYQSIKPLEIAYDR